MFGVGHPLLAAGPGGGPRHRDPRRAHPDRRSRRSSACCSGSRLAGGSVGHSCSGWRSRWPAPSCCCGRSTDRGELDTAQGRIAVGWLIVEDLVTIVILVLLPTIAPLLGGTSSAPTDALGTLGSIALGLGKAALFVIVMIVAGTRLVPRLLPRLARGLERAVHPGRAGHRARDRVPVVDGLRRLVRARSLPGGRGGRRIGPEPQAAADALPLRDAFAVLFFVSVGMLLDPAVLIADAAGDRGRRSCWSSSARRSRSS